MQANHCYQGVEEEDGYFHMFFLLDVIDSNNRKDKYLVVNSNVIWPKLYKRLKKKKNRLNTRLDRKKKNLKIHNNNNKIFITWKERKREENTYNEERKIGSKKENKTKIAVFAKY